MAVGNVSCIMIGEYIGDRRPKETKTTYYLSFLLIYIIESFIVAVLLIWKDEIGHLFSSDDEVATMLSNIL